MSTMEQSGGGEPPDDHAGAGGEDLLSMLPDDVLVLILLYLDIRPAARTSILSRRWRRVWTLLPKLRFRFDSRCLLSVLSASDVPLRSLYVLDFHSSPESLAAWLPAAARRLSGDLRGYFSGTKAVDGEAEESQRRTFELPCFEKATSIYLTLGFLGLSVPPAGVFARLTDLHLTNVWFHGPAELGDAVSSPRCPCLQELTICNVRGLDTITINSESLQLLQLQQVRGVRQIIVVAPALIDLSILYCFITDRNQPVVNISAPQLSLLEWTDAYDPSSVHLGSMTHLQTLNTLFVVYGPDNAINTHLQTLNACNRACLNLLPRYRTLGYLTLSLDYPLGTLDGLQYLMEDITVVPKVTSLHLIVEPRGHTFGACTFHVLRICSGLRRLKLDLCPFSEEQTVCSSGCICGQPTNWKTEELLLNHLHELEIDGFRASKHEIALVKRLFTWVPVLKMMTVTSHHSISESKAKKIFQIFRIFSNPGLCMKFYTCHEFSKVLYAPEY